MRPCRLYPAALVLLLSTTALAHPGVAHDIEEITEQIARNPDDVGLWIERADLFRRERDFERAALDLEHAQELAPRHRLVALGWARVLVATGELEDARKSLERYFALGGDSPEAHALLATSLLAMGEAAAALEAYDASLLRAADVDVFVQRARLAASLGLLPRALEGLEDGVARTEAGVLRLLVVRLALASGQPDRALRALAPLLAQARVKTRLLLLEAEALEQKGAAREARSKRLQALADAERLAKKRPSPMALADRARAHAALGDRARALADAEQAVRGAPAWAEGREVLEALRAGVRP